MYLKRRLEEAEAEKQFLFEKIKLQENQKPAHQASSSGGAGGGAGVADPMMLSKIQEMLKNVRSMPAKSEGL
jgi:hypothetical protein